jgi:hypothetical protein
MFLTYDIRVVLSCSLNISCSSPSHASLDPQPAAGTPAVPVHPSSPAQISSSSSEATSSSRSSPPLKRHVRRTVSALGRLEHAASAGGRGCRDKGTRAAAETAATAARLTMTELTAARAEVEVAAAADAARAAAAELEALRASSTGNSVFADDDRDNELKLAREAAREQTAQWAAVHPQGRRGGSPDGHRRRVWRPCPRRWRQPR